MSSRNKTELKLCGFKLNRRRREMTFNLKIMFLIQDWTILTGSWVGTKALQEWDWTTGKVIKDIPFNYSGHDGAYLYCAQYCDNDVVIAGGSGTNSVQAVNKVTGEVSLTELIGNINDLSPFTIF